MKALNYLATSTTDNHSDAESLECLHYPDGQDKDEVDHFALHDFRPGLARDHDDLHHGGRSRSNSNSSGSGPSTSGASPTAAPSSSGAGSPTSRRQRKCSIGGRFYKTSLNSGEFPCKSEVKRKLSDGHVHWADEFHKDLTRCHPRKQYSRHPSHLAHHVKPILKPNSGEDAELDDC